MQNFLIRDENAQYFECGYSCDNAIYLKLGSEAFFITDGRYTTEARAEVKNAEVVEARELLKKARELLRKNKIKHLVVNPNDLSASEFTDLHQKCRAHIGMQADFSRKKRIVKTDTEIAKIKESQRLNTEAFDQMSRYLRHEAVGLPEYAIHHQAKSLLTRKGEFDLSFDPIVGINGSAAKPHALPTRDILKEGDLVLFDAGIKYARYCSDRTRTAQIGQEMNYSKSQNFSHQKRQKIYDIVLKSQMHAIENARSGMRACEIDKLARSVIEDAGYGKQFMHSTGHGIGLDIHELPMISSRSKTVIEDGMVFTIEPGIYFPGEFGVRIEDIVVMKNGRAEIL